MSLRQTCLLCYYSSKLQFVGTVGFPYLSSIMAHAVSWG